MPALCAYQLFVYTQYTHRSEYVCVCVHDSGHFIYFQHFN